MATMTSTSYAKIETGAIPSDPEMSGFQKQQFKIANNQIAVGQFSKAHETLGYIKHPRANRWILKLETMHPELKKPIVVEKAVEKRNLWPIIIVLAILAIISIIVATRRMEDIPFLPSQSGPVPTQMSYTRVDCKGDIYEACKELKLNLISCGTGADMKTYNECVITFNKAIAELQNQK